MARRESTLPFSFQRQIHFVICNRHCRILTYLLKEPANGVCIRHWPCAHALTGLCSTTTAMLCPLCTVYGHYRRDKVGKVCLLYSLGSEQGGQQSQAVHHHAALACHPEEVLCQLPSSWQICLHPTYAVVSCGSTHISAGMNNFGYNVVSVLFVTSCVGKLATCLWKQRKGLSWARQKKNVLFPMRHDTNTRVNKKTNNRKKHADKLT